MASSLVVSILACVNLSALGTQLYVPSPAKKEVGKQLKELLHCSNPPKDDYTEITFTVGEDGCMYEPKITHYSGSDQFDAECFEAVCGLHNLPSPHNIQLDLEHITERFGPAHPDYIQSKSTGGEVEEFLKHHSLKTGEVVVHKVPLWVLSVYPGLFKPEELMNPKNLMIIPADVAPNPRDSEGNRASSPEYVADLKLVNGRFRSLLKEQQPLTKEFVSDLTIGIPNLLQWEVVKENSTTSPSAN